MELCQKLHDAEQKVVEKGLAAEKKVAETIVKTAEKIVKKVPGSSDSSAGNGNVDGPA